jgi:hypothetical protein
MKEEETMTNDVTKFAELSCEMQTELMWTFFPPRVGVEDHYVEATKFLENEFAGPVFFPFHGSYNSVAACVEACVKNRWEVPKFVWGLKMEPADQPTPEGMLVEQFGGIDEVGLSEEACTDFRDMLAEWWKKHGQKICYLEPDYSQLVILDQSGGKVPPLLSV